MGVKNIIGELQVNGSPVITEDTMPEASGFSGSYNDLTNVPEEFTPSSHTHIVDDVSGLQDALDEKATKAELAETQNSLLTSLEAIEAKLDELAGGDA